MYMNDFAHTEPSKDFRESSYIFAHVNNQVCPFSSPARTQVLEAAHSKHVLRPLNFHGPHRVTEVPQWVWLAVMVCPLISCPHRMGTKKGL